MIKDQVWRKTLDEKPNVLDSVIVWHNASDWSYHAYLDEDGFTWRRWSKVSGNEKRLDFIPDYWMYADAIATPNSPNSDDGIEKQWKDAFASIKAATICCPKTIEQRVIKLSEEVGELARAISILREHPCTKYRGAATIDDVIEEIADVLIVTLSLYQDMPRMHGLDLGSPNRLLDAVEKKVGKWRTILLAEGA